MTVTTVTDAEALEALRPMLRADDYDFVAGDVAAGEAGLAMEAAFHYLALDGITLTDGPARAVLAAWYQSMPARRRAIAADDYAAVIG